MILLTTRSPNIQIQVDRLAFIGAGDIYQQSLSTKLALEKNEGPISITSLGNLLPKKA